MTFKPEGGWGKALMNRPLREELPFFAASLSHLEKPAKFDDDPLHGAQVKKHGDTEVEEVDDGQNFEHEHGRDGLVEIYLNKYNCMYICVR